MLEVINQLYFEDGELTLFEDGTFLIVGESAHKISKDFKKCWERASLSLPVTAEPWFYNSLMKKINAKFKEEKNEK